MFFRVKYLNKQLKKTAEVRNSDVRTVLQKCEWCNTTSHLSVCTVPVIGIGDTGLLRSSFTRLHLLGLRGHAGLAVIVSTWKRAWLLMCIFSPEKEHEFEDKPRSSKPHTFSLSLPLIFLHAVVYWSHKRENSFSPTQKCYSFITEMCAVKTTHALYHFRCDTSYNSIMGELHQIQWSIFKGSWGNKVYKMP